MLKPSLNGSKILYYLRVDYFKYDNCYNLNVPAKDRYEAMHKALNETKRTIFYSICNWGE